MTEGLATIELLGTVLFGLAVLHTFSVRFFQRLALRFPEGSVGENLFHLLGEVEIVFGLWAGLFAALLALAKGAGTAIAYVEGLDFKEPLFVFAIMTIASSKPVIDFARSAVSLASPLLPLPGKLPFLLSCLFLGPLLGSLITEPAAMTVTALLLKEQLFDRGLSERARYAALGTLFVNVSIGGVLTPFAAPPVLMVADRWNLGAVEMLGRYGWKATLACALNAALLGFLFRKELRDLPSAPAGAKGAPIPLRALHLAILALVVLTAHHPVIFLGLLLFFLGLVTITREHQPEPAVRQSLLVAFFLAGLVVFGALQKWWVEPLIAGMDPLGLFLGAAGLTAVTDNAALTYLGSQIPGIGEGFKYSLLAGAVAGGGLTVIANAPNPAGYSILKDSFGPVGISALRLFQAALIPTLIGMLCFWLLPSLA
jgi:hypothetical protein